MQFVKAYFHYCLKMMLMCVSIIGSFYVFLILSIVWIYTVVILNQFSLSVIVFILPFIVLCAEENWG